MADNNLLETYNPLYDVHLRQYFASPNMQKHLRSLGLLDSNGVPVAQGDNNVEGQLYARHQVMMDMMLRNRERVLMQLADLQKKLDAAEKVEIYRRIRSGLTNAEEFRRHHLTTRSFSRPARGRARDNADQKHQRRNSYDESELVKRVESDIDAAQNEYAQQHKSLYSRLAANAYKFAYLHKLDDRTLLNYKETLQRQLQKLERFREVSFGPHSVAKHQPNTQMSWFFRRRSLPSIKTADSTATSHKTAQRSVEQRNSKSANRQRAGKSVSPHRANKLATLSSQPTQQRKPKAKPAPRKLPPLPKQQSKAKTTSSSSSTGTQKLPPTAVVKPSKKREKEVENRASSGASVDKLPKIAVAGALAGGAALAGATLITSDPEPHPEISDTDVSRPETGSDALPSDAEQSIGTSPQPHSDIEPEFQQQTLAEELEQSTPKEEHSNQQMFNYAQDGQEDPPRNDSVVEDPIQKIESEPEEVTPVEEHIRHTRSVEESQPPESERSIEDGYSNNEEQAYMEPTSNENAYDSAIYSSDSNPLHDGHKLEETPRSEQLEDDNQSEATQNAEHSAFSPRSMNEDELSPHNDVQMEEERNETPMSKDSIEPVENEMIEPVSRFQQEEFNNEEFNNEEVNEQTPQQESRQFVEEESNLEQPYEKHSQMQTSVYHQKDEVENPESPNSQMQTSVYEQNNEIENPESPNSQMSKLLFAESESEPNLHYQTESFQEAPVETASEEHHADDRRFQQNFDLSNDNSIPVMEGESLRDSEDETQPVGGPLDGDSMTAVDNMHMEESPRQHFENYGEVTAHETDLPSGHEEDSQSHQFETQNAPLHEESYPSPPQSANNHLLVAQPSIEITPASDYSGSREHLERIGESTPEAPKTPSSASDQNDDSGHPTEHEGLDSDNHLADDPDMTPPSTGKPSDNHEDDIETIPPPVSHSPLTFGDEEEPNQEQYHLPESPDPNAHNTLIPDQHEDNALTVPDIDDQVPRDHVPEDEHEVDAPNEYSSNYDSQRGSVFEHQSNVDQQSQQSAPNTERSYEEEFPTPHPVEQNFEDEELHESEHDTNRNDEIHQNEHDHNGNQMHMETTYQHEYQNGHNEEIQNGEHHSDEEVFNNGVNGNHQNGESNGFQHEETGSLVRKSVGDEDALDSEKEETSSVIIHDSPETEHRKLEQTVDGQATGASQL
ncbi:hypothetical protein M3Y97_00150400 [Aphelenchoides bicaudatus]|nr:hypothetical protein M3Y97_00150400 [Aphelenchoides bicaudatus]